MLTRLLTPREIEVLRLLARGFTCRQTARHLHVSANTVQTHTKNIYMKLDVHSARAAIWRALEIGLLSA
jgi:LuxR family maltose regulon positive regulatory protein